jgi:phosphate transport system permease protein
VLVLALFALARVIGGRGSTQLSARQRRAVAGASLRDIHRIQTKARQTQTAADTSTKGTPS